MLRPNPIDWREHGKVSPVDFQGFHCDSSYAYAAVGAIESALAIANQTEIVPLSIQ